MAPGEPPRFYKYLYFKFPPNAPNIYKQWIKRVRGQWWRKSESGKWYKVPHKWQFSNEYDIHGRKKRKDQQYSKRYED
jgi:hypothetical protein